MMTETRHTHRLGGAGLRNKGLGAEEARGKGCNNEFVSHDIHSGSGWLHSKDGAVG
jgi:hypothetical protein